MNLRLNAVKLGLAGGILWGVSLFLMTLMAVLTGYGMFWLAPWMDVYFGYDISWIGAFIGLIYGFLDGFFFFLLLAWLYNLLNKKSAQ